MTLREIYTHLDALSPFETQESWDNSGLLVGEMSDEVEQICLSLDIDKALLESVPEKTLIITHHPLIFKGLKRFDASRYPASLLKIMIKKDISLISMHTNFDQSHLNRYVAREILGFELDTCEEYYCYAKVDMSFDDLALHVKKKLGLEPLRVVKGHDHISSIALTTGSGGDLIGGVKADCYLTGDLKYHQAIEARENGLSLMDIGHYESERYFGDALALHLKNLPLQVIMSNSKNPFEYR